MSDIQPNEQDDFGYDIFTNLGGGINRQKSARNLEASEFVLVENLRYDEDSLKIDYGIEDFAINTSFGASIKSRFRRTESFANPSGIVELIAISNLTAFTYNIGSKQWHLLSSGTATTTTTGDPSGTSVVNVTSEAGFTAGEPFAIYYDSGAQFITTIASTAAGVINLVDAIPTVAGDPISIGNDCYEGVLLTGTDSEEVHSKSFPALGWFLFTNNMDSVMRYDGTDLIVVPGLPSSGDTKCKALALFNNYILLIATTEGGIDHHRRVRWCDTGNPGVWAGGNSGFEDLFDSNDTLVSAENLGPYIIIYRTNSIVRGEFLNTNNQLFDFEQAVSGQGILSVNSVTKYLEKHFVFGNDSLYLYSGGYVVEEIDTKVKDLVYGDKGDLNAAEKDKTFVFYSSFYSELWAFYPSLSAEFPDRFIRYSEDTKTWFLRTLNEETMYASEYTDSNFPTWNDLTGTWDDQTWAWDDRAASSGIPKLLMCTTIVATPTHHVRAYSITAGNDVGIPISYKIETKDFGNPRYEIRFDYLNLKGKGTNILIEYSTDFGSTWISLGTFTIPSSAPLILVELDFISLFTRFRFSGSGGAFELEYYGLSQRLDAELIK